MSERTDRFAVSTGTRLFTHLCHAYPRLWNAIERLETAFVSEELERIAIEGPVYVAGLARSGTTILLELLASLPGVATHRYRDFPPLWTPVLWNRYLALVPARVEQPKERPHGDGIAITPDSPEAMEEPIWMRHFPHSHDPAVSDVLDRATRNDAFADFYRRHIRKILLARGGRRYVAKGNYNLARLGYLHALFPDARFVIPVRHPVSHVASLVRQHESFTKAQLAHPAARDYLRRVGHFEFGLDRAPINMAGTPPTTEILDLWRRGDEVSGWAAYWSHVYGAVLNQLERDATLRQAVLVVHYERLNAHPVEELRRVLEHCGIEADATQVANLAARLRQPDYYKSPFTGAQEEAILRIAGPTMARYDSGT